VVDVVAPERAVDLHSIGRIVYAVGLLTNPVALEGFLMRVGEMAKETGVPGQTLQRLAKAGIIPAKRLPRKSAHWRFATADLESIRAILIGAGLIESPAKKKIESPAKKKK
jgi:excisionase family DNA binding protein